MATAGPRESLLTAENMHRVSVGVDYLFLQRDVNLGGKEGKLSFKHTAANSAWISGHG